MSERIYSARPINTYTGIGAEVGDAYVAFVKKEFPKCTIVDPGDPNGEVSKHAKELFDKHMINPATGEKDEKYYNEHGSVHVMAYFTNEVVGPCTIGTGLMLPVYGARNGFAVGAGVAAEMKKMYDLGRPLKLMWCVRNPGLHFFVQDVSSIAAERGGIDPVSKKSLYTFYTRAHLAFNALSVDETRARMYTKRSDGTWDRDNLQPYFLG